MAGLTPAPVIEFKGAWERSGSLGYIYKHYQQLSVFSAATLPRLPILSLAALSLTLAAFGGLGMAV
jgi:hypothetical protein